MSQPVSNTPHRSAELPLPVRLSLSAGFLLAVAAYLHWMPGNGGWLLLTAAVVGGYMAMNIGANDVANNVGPAIGAGALSLLGAILIAGVMEAAGALLAGGDVVGTVKGDIIDPTKIADPQVFVWLMLAALLAGALWLNLATASGAPVSTTHSIVGGVLGAGIAAGGWEVANWATLKEIAMSWVISPVMGGLIAAAFLYIIKRTITYQADMNRAACRVVPVLTGLMAWAFTIYLITKGLKQIVKVEMPVAVGLGLILGVVTWFGMSRFVAGRAERLGNDKESVNKLFFGPLVASAALLSFAHGANDVANAVGPLAAIQDVLSNALVSSKAPIPLWVMMVGALGIVFGLSLFGPRLIRTVGSEITDLDAMRAFCIAMAAALTVLVASHLGLPVSSTHIAVGGVFGVGFLREFLKASYVRQIIEIEAHHHGEDREVVDAFLKRFEKAEMKEQGQMLLQLRDERREKRQVVISKQERKSLKKVYQKQIVKRSLVVRIAAAWVITVPASALLAAMVFFMLRGMLLP